MLSLPQGVFAFVTLFVSGLVSGLTGFGGALVATPLLILVLPPRMVVPLLALNGVVSSLFILYESRRWLEPRRIWPLMLAGAAGVPIGAYALMMFDVGALKVLIGVAITLSALAFLLGFRRQLTHERLASAPIGFVSGVLDGSIGMAGPPVTLFFANQGVEKRAFRANLALYFLVLNVVRVPSYLVGGLLTEAVLGYAVLLFPAPATGLWVGMRLMHRVDEALFRKLVLLVVGGAGMIAVASGLRLF